MRRFAFDRRSLRLWLLAALVATIMVYLEHKLSEQKRTRERMRPVEEVRSPADPRDAEANRGKDAKRESDSGEGLHTIEFIELEGSH